LDQQIPAEHTLEQLGTKHGSLCLAHRKVALIIGGNSGIGLLFARPTAHLLLVSGISDVALAVSVGKHAPEIQYLRTSISEEQRREFGRLLETTITRSSRVIRFAQWHSLSTERLRQLLSLGALPEQ
jgi:NAD(P)-dependent dehydrogenase (short-subunit alcohol dehydrogenase family)